MFVWVLCVRLALPPALIEHFPLLFAGSAHADMSTTSVAPPTAGDVLFSNFNVSLRFDKLALILCGMLMNSSELSKNRATKKSRKKKFEKVFKKKVEKKSSRKLKKQKNKKKLCKSCVEVSVAPVSQVHQYAR